MEWWHRLELGPHLAPVEWVADRAGWPLFLSLDSSTDPLASEVRPRHGPIGDHIDPFTEQDVLA